VNHARPPANQAMRVVLLTNIVPAYWATTVAGLAIKFPGMCVLRSTARLGQNRAEDRMVDGVRQVSLKTVVVRRQLVHPDGFKWQFDVQVPYDVIAKLFALRPAVMIAAELGARTLQAMIYRLVVRSSRIIIHADLSEDSERAFGRVRSALRRFLLARADLVVVNGQSGARYVLKVGGRPNRIVVIPYATDDIFLAAPPRASLDGPARALLYVGQLIERKGLLNFLECLARWCERYPAERVQLTLIGDGPLRSSIANASRPANLTVLTNGMVPYGALPDHYRTADLMVFPTLADTWGLVVNEAMAMGVPVLGSIRSQAVTELIEDGVSGWWIDPTSPSDMDRGLDRALQASGEMLSEIATRARARARQVTPEYAAGQFEDAIRRVIKQ
jgi:glycosyltransferase involved in cell wall biosynthesis